MSKLSNLGRGVHLHLQRGAPGEWRATLRLNADEGGSGVSAVGCATSAADAVRHAAALAHAALANPIVQKLLPPGTPQALDVTNRLADLAERGQLSKVFVGPQGAHPLWRHFENPVLREIAKQLARASEGASVSGCPVTLLDGAELGWRGGGGRGAFGARTAYARRYARARRMPSRRSPHGAFHRPHPRPFLRPAVTPGPYPYGYDWPDPTDPDSQMDDGANDPSQAAPSAAPTSAPDPAVDPAIDAAPTSETPTPSAPQRGKHKGKAAPATNPDPAIDAATTQGYEMGWNPFHAISHAIHSAVHAAVHGVGKVAGAVGRTLEKFKEPIAVAAAAAASAVVGPEAAPMVMKLVPSIIDGATGNGDAKEVVAAATAAAATDPTVAQALDAAHEAVANTTAAFHTGQDVAASVSGEWSPSPYYGTARPSYGLVTRRPISFADAYGRIYGPQPRYFRFQKPY